MRTHHGFGSHTERVIFTTNADGGTTGEDALIDDTHSSHRIVDSIVNILNQGHTTCSNSNGALRDAVAQ